MLHLSHYMPGRDNSQFTIFRERAVMRLRELIMNKLHNVPGMFVAKRAGFTIYYNWQPAALADSDQPCQANVRWGPCCAYRCFIAGRRA